MGIHRIEAPDGTVITVEAPDGASPDAIVKYAQAMHQRAANKSGPTDRDTYLNSPLVRLAKGMKDPIDAAAQMLSRAAPKSVMDAAVWVSDKLGMPDPTPKGVDAAIAEGEREYQSARQATAPETLTSLVTGRKDPGTDWMRLAGNVASPANAGIARMLPVARGAATVGQLAKTGAVGGAAGGVLAPVTDEQSQANFAATKAKQGAAGIATGAVLTPAIGRAVEVIVPRVLSLFQGKSVRLTADQIDAAIEKVLADSGLDSQSVPPAMRESLRQTVAKSMSGAGNVDAAAALRSADFESLGMKPTLGQITRDPSQFANERNLRGVAGVGEPLLTRFSEQGKQLSDALSRFGGPNAADRVTAGESISRALSGVDESIRSHVSAAYRGARDASAASGAEIPLQGLAQDAADIFRRYDGVPAIKGISNMMEDFGIVGDGMRQTKVFGYDEAEALLKQINKLRGDGTTLAAASELRNAVKNAITQGGTPGPYDAARAAAAKRFQLHEAIPSLKAAAEGTVAPDDFVNRFVINGKAGDVFGMAKLLAKSDPKAFQEARAQVGAKLQEAAFGQNLAGDKAFSPERFAKALKDLGDRKLQAFYSPQEIEALHRIARVGAYIHSVPNAAAVNFSNNSGWALSVMQRIPGMGEVANAAAAVIRGVARTVGNDRAVRQSLGAEIPKIPPKLTPQQEAQLLEFAPFVGFGGGLLQPVR